MTYQYSASLSERWNGIEIFANPRMNRTLIERYKVLRGAVTVRMTVIYDDGLPHCCLHCR